MNQRSEIRARPWRGPGATISALQAWTGRGCCPLRAAGRERNGGRHPRPGAGVRPLPSLWRARRDAPARGLGGRGADGEREAAPRGQPRKGRGQVQDDAAYGARHPDRDLDEALAQRGDLGPGAGRAPRMLLQRLVQEIRRPGQQDADLVGEKPRATGPARSSTTASSRRGCSSTPMRSSPATGSAISTCARESPR